MRRIAALSIAAIVAVSGCTSGKSGSISPQGDSGDTGASTPDETGALDWSRCDGDTIAVESLVLNQAAAKGMKCASMEVPVDHEEPDGATITLALARVPATKPSERIGSLVFNPGGPGGSGLEFLASSAALISPDIAERFDLVSFDPRGLGASSPLECLTPDQREEWISRSSDEVADTPEMALEFETAVAQGCEADDAALYANIGTDAVVEDLDLIREALGEDQLNFMGISYGTRIGALYASRHPDRVRAIILDSPVTPDRSLAALAGGQAASLAESLAQFYRWCDADPECALQPDAASAARSQAERLEVTPIEVEGENGLEQLDGSMFETALITAMYDPAMSQPLAEAIVALDASGAERERAAAFLLRLAGLQHSRQPDGTYGNGFEVQTLVSCADAEAPLSSQEAEQIAESTPTLLLPDDAEPSASCTILPTGGATEITTSTAAERVLVIGSVGDPATPYAWMSQMADALGTPKRITYSGTGHGVALSQPCVSAQLVAFLTDPVAFTPTDCEQNPDERDIYATIAGQFTDLGLPGSTIECIVEGLKERISPLAIAADDGSDIDSELLTEISRIAIGCR